MNILFIKPPNTHELYVDLPKEIDDSRGLYPPLGILYVASYLRKHSDANIKVLDMCVEKVSLDDLPDYIHDIKPDIVGIQGITYTLIDTIQTANKIKEIDDTITVVIGGIHSTIYPEETIKVNCVDYVIVGEGEVPFSELVNNFHNRDALRTIKGLVYKENGRIINNGKSDVIANIDALPFPARDLIPIKKYYSVLGKGSPLTTLITSKGCPNQCAFCDRPTLENKYRERSPENVVDEIEECISMGIYEFSFYDDTFTMNKKRAEAICDEIIRRGLKISWDARSRVNTIDEKLISKLKKAGCDRLYYGVESGDTDILKRIKKNISLEQVEKAFLITKKYKIEILAYFMIGLPGESKEQIYKSIKFAKKIGADFVSFSIFTPLPATEIYDNCVKEGIIDDYWRDFASNPDINFKPHVYDQILQENELKEILFYAYKSYYLNPFYILKRIQSIKSFNQLLVQAKAGARLLKLKFQA